MLIHRLLLSGLLCVGLRALGDSPPPALKQSDVVFMYQSDRATYAEYGATVLAWGGKPTTQSLAAAQGVRFFGSVGMVTEFARFHDRFPRTYEAALCRDVNGNPVKVPWLTDHQHNGVPFWWCCTQQPLFRAYLQERVVETVQAGAEGVHIDDHLGTSGGLWLGICFCDRCVQGFRAYLGTLPADDRARFGVTNHQQFDYREVVRDWIAAAPSLRRTPPQHPLWSQWSIYQCRAAAAFMADLHTLASKTAGRPVPMGANAGLLWPRHLSDHATLDLFSAETDHHADQRRFSDQPLFAYRLAEAVDRPYASTASGGDWAFIKEQNLPGLVRGWIAQSYAAGQRLMAPHHQWCYTPQKGTHWYDGPTARFAPLYRFVREHAPLFDDYATFADLAVVMPHASFVENPRRWFELGQALADQNLSYTILLGGDAIVDHSLAPTALRSTRALLAPKPDDLLPADRRALAEHARLAPVYQKLEEALAAIKPVVRISSGGPVRAFPRVKAGAAVVHLVNYDYDPAQDDVRPLRNLRVTLDLAVLGLARLASCRLIMPGTPPVPLTVEAGSVEVPVLGLWGILAFESAPAP
jgi:hypothetical protein